MNKKILGIGNAIVDVLARVDDSFLIKNNLTKGSMKLINESEFDKIFCLNVVYFWDNLQKPFEKIKSFLKNDGFFFFYMAKKERLSEIKFAKDEIFNKYSIEQVTDALKEAGFSEITYFEKFGYYIKAKK